MLVHFLVTVTNIVNISQDGKAHVSVQTIFYIEAAVRGMRFQLEQGHSARAHCQQMPSAFLMGKERGFAMLSQVTLL